MTRIVVDPNELERFAGLAVEAAEDYESCAAALGNLEHVSMPPDMATIVNGVVRIAADVDALSAFLYAEAMMVRTRAAVLDPLLRRYLVSRPTEPPG